MSSINSTSTLLLKVDNRELKCKDYLNNVPIEYSNLVFGDFQICIRNKDSNETDEIQFLFERKTLDDLLASIKDGRYKNQKASILSNFDCKQYYYIIEGNVIFNMNPTKVQDKIIHSAIINTQLRDKIGIFFTRNVNETCQLIQSIYNRIKDNPTDYICKKDINNGNTNVMIEKQICSKKIKTASECWKEQLCQIPDISGKTADAILKEYSSMKEFYKTFMECSKEEAIKKLESIKTVDANGKQRKISSKCVQNIIQYVLFVEE
jgi:ERCC4-type nuclease